MDLETNINIDNTYQPQEGNNQSVLKKRIVLIGIIGVIFIILLVILLLSSNRPVKQVLQPNTTPTPIAISPPTTKKSLEDLKKSQSESDRKAGVFLQNVHDNYPWFNKLPLQTKDYFVYFDLSTKTLIANLYPKQSSSPIDEQVSFMKRTVILELNSIGVNSTTYPPQWKIIPQ